MGERTPDDCTSPNPQVAVSHSRDARVGWAAVGIFAVVLLLAGSCEKASDEVRQLRGDVKGLTDQLAEKERTITDLHKQLATTGTEGDKRVARYEATIQARDADLQTLKKDLEELRRRCPEDVQKALQQCDDEKERLRKSYEEAALVNASAHQTELLQLKGSAAELKTKVGDLTRNVLNTEEERENFRRTADMERQRREQEYQARSKLPWYLAAGYVPVLLLALLGLMLRVHGMARQRKQDAEHLRALQYAPIRGYEIVVNEVSNDK